MSWWLNIIEYLKSSESESGDGKFSFKKSVNLAIAESAVDFLYYALGFFTFLYFLAAVYLFFGDSGIYRDLLVRIFDTLSEPYFGSIGIYVILKEVRKQRLGMKSRHLGEYFVYFWLFLFFIAVLRVIFSPDYHFDELMSAITKITLALTVIYAGGLIHKP